MSVPRSPPGPPGWPLIGNSLDVFRGDPLARLLARHRAYGDVVRTRVGPNEILLVNDPDGVRHVLQRNHANYTKGPSYALLEPVVGKGLLTSEGDAWLRHRKIVQPAFHRGQLQGIGEVVVRRAEALAASLRSRPDRGEVDLSALMMRLTFDIVGEALFSDEVDAEAGEVADALAKGLSLFDRFLGLVLLIPPGTPLPRRPPLLGIREVAHRLDRLVLDIIDRRRRSGEARDDLLGLLMAARYEDGGALSETQIKDEALTLILAGHETTANALTWTFALLSRHPEIARALEAEVDAFAAGGGALGTAALDELPLTDRVVREAMRLYPPAWMVVRRAIGPDEICGYPVAAGTSIQISPWTLHRHPAHWTDPDRFDPDRFAPEAARTRSKWVYLPFGGGPRACVGKGLAMIEARLVLATLVRHFRIDISADNPLVPHPTVTLRPRDPVLAHIALRHPQETLPDSP